MVDLDPKLGVYGITTVANLTGVNPQTLRLYEAHGIVTPDRTSGGTRRYSAEDISRLNRVAGLLSDGVNLASVGMVLGLQDANGALQAENDALRAGSGRPTLDGPEVED